MTGATHQIACPRCMPPGDPCCPYCGGTYGVDAPSPQPTTPQTDAAAMLRALLADRARVEAELDIHRRAVDEAEAMIARLEADRTDLKNILREQGHIHERIVAGLRAHRAALLAEVRAWRHWCENSDKSNDDLVCAAVAATDALLGAEVAE